MWFVPFLERNNLCSMAPCLSIGQLPPSFLLFLWLFWLSRTSGQVLISNALCSMAPCSSIGQLPPSFLLFLWLFWLSRTSGQVLISNAEPNNNTWLHAALQAVWYQSSLQDTCIQTAKVWPQKANKATFWRKSRLKIDFAQHFIESTTELLRFWANMSRIISLKLTSHFPFSTPRFREFRPFSVSRRNGGFNVLTDRLNHGWQNLSSSEVGLCHLGCDTLTYYHMLSNLHPVIKVERNTEFSFYVSSK